MRMSNLTEIRARTITVTTSGTPVQGSSLVVPPGVTVVAKAGRNNTGVISVAESSTNALNTGENNFQLQSGESLGLQVLNTNMLWFDSTVSGDTVRIVFEFEPNF